LIFSSITFLYYFLPWVLVLYFIVPLKYKNLVLLLASLLFYAWGEPKIVFCMIATISVSYVLGLLTEKNAKNKKLYMIMAVVLSLGSLGYFKYADFFIENINAVTGMSVPLLRIALPVGISFYTFQVLSYNIDVYRGQIAAQKSFVKLAAYITMFPQLIAGPIVRYQDIEKQLTNKKFSSEGFVYGIRRFILGLSKKVLIANILGEICASFGASNNLSVLYYWMYAVAFALQIYFDFSGYSDMAIGLGKILGFDFMENFNYPYVSKSITEFWRRWHISLGSWFRDYVYIPMGGSRVNKGRMYFNILVVWMLTGLWHGAAWNFVVWGLYFALFLVIEKTFLLKHLDKFKVLNHVYVIVLTIISFVIFNAPSMSQAFSDIGGMFGFGNVPLYSAEAVYYLKSYALIFVMAILGATPLPKMAISKFKAAKYAEPLVMIILLIVVTAYLIDGSFNPFLYFRF